MISFLNYSGFDFQQTLYFITFIQETFEIDLLASEYKPADVLSMTVLLSPYVQMLLGFALFNSLFGKVPTQSMDILYVQPTKELLLYSEIKSN